MYQLIKAASDKISMNELQQRLVKAGHKCTVSALYNAIERKSKVKTSPEFFKVMAEILGKKEVDKAIYGK